MFGCGNVGGLLIRSDADTMRRAVRRALDLGINWFDTAALYGDGQSEENLGRLLNELNDTPYVSTKVRLVPETWPIFQLRLSKTRCKASRV
jgi:L-galactose dehydrogenase/L-glyceraldehyde 3-phosphate reductase